MTIPKRNDVFEFRADDPTDDDTGDVDQHGVETGTDGKKGKKRRVRLTLKEKIMLVRHSWENPRLTHRKLMVWSQNQFGKEKSVCPTSISRILRNADVLQAAGTETRQLSLSMKTNRKPKRSTDSAQKVAKAHTWLVSAKLEVGQDICNVLADRKKWQDALPAKYIAYACSEVSGLSHPGAVQVEILVHARSGHRISQYKLKKWLGSDGIKEMEYMPILPGARNHFTTHTRVKQFFDETALRNDAAGAGKRTRVIWHGIEDSEADTRRWPSLSRNTTMASGATASAAGGAEAAAPVPSQPLPPSNSFRVPPASSLAPISAQQADFSNDTRPVNRNSAPPYTDAGLAEEGEERERDSEGGNWGGRPGDRKREEGREVER
jgi:hypothetical protein